MTEDLKIADLLARSRKPRRPTPRLSTSQPICSWPPVARMEGDASPIPDDPPF